MVLAGAGAALCLACAPFGGRGARWGRDRGEAVLWRGVTLLVRAALRDLLAGGLSVRPTRSRRQPEAGPSGRHTEAPPKPDLPRLWRLFPFILPRKVRREVYEPACWELIEDYLEAQRLATTPWARRWLTFALTVRTIGLVLGSLHAAVGDRVVTFAGKLMGEAAKRLLGG